MLALTQRTNGAAFWFAFLGLSQLSTVRAVVSFRDVFFIENPSIADVRLIDPVSNETIQSLLDNSQVDMARAGDSPNIEIDVIEYPFWPVGFITADYYYNGGERVALHLLEPPYIIRSVNGPRDDDVFDGLVLPLSQQGSHLLSVTVRDPEYQVLGFENVTWVVTDSPVEEKQSSDTTIEETAVVVPGAVLLPPSPAPTATVVGVPAPQFSDTAEEEIPPPTASVTMAPTISSTVLATSVSESMFNYVLFDTTTDHPILTLKNGDTISLSTVRTTDITIVPQPKANPELVVYVKFTYGEKVHFEFVAPYAMGGNSGTDFDVNYYSVDWLSSPGKKKIDLEVGLTDGFVHTESLVLTIVATAPNQGTPGVVLPISDPVTAPIGFQTIVPATTAPVKSPTVVIFPTMVAVTVPAPVIVPTTKGPTVDLPPAPVGFLEPPVEILPQLTLPHLTFPLPQATVSQGGVVVAGELKKWHKLTLVFDGPNVSETSDPNPFTDYRLDVNFRNEQSNEEITVPGYFAADGNAADSSAEAGSKWHCHFSAPSTGQWAWEVRFLTGPNVAMQWPDRVSGTPAYFHGTTGSFIIQETDKTGRDLRSKGLLRYVGQHHLQFAETGEWFLKCGSDSPENFLAYDDIDNTGIRSWSLKSWEPHQRDFRAGDPTWGDGNGSEIMGAVNYLADQGMNAFSFLTFSLEGDDKNVYPYRNTTDFTRMDVSKLAQWEMVFEHADKQGMFMHFKTQETENDHILDGGELGDERKLYYRELIARFSHHLALNWNIGEENTNTDMQRKAFADWFSAVDPYDHPIVVHTYIGDQSDVYGPLYGYPSYEGASIQSWHDNVFRDSLARVQESAAAGRPWIVSNDEQAGADEGVAPDSADPDHYKIRSHVLWGNIMAGGAGVEYYFGYAFENSDLTAQDLRSRANMWTQSRYALDFFSKFGVPFQNMSNRNNLVTDPNWCLVERGITPGVLVVYLPFGGTTFIDLAGVAGDNVSVRWYDPRNGGELQIGSTPTLPTGSVQSLGDAPGYVQSLGDSPLVAASNSTSTTGLIAPIRPETDWVVLVESF